MPSVAHDPEDGSLEFAARAEPNHRYICPECDQRVAFVPQHKRGDNTDVRSFFRYDNCSHRGVSVGKNGAVGGGGAGAGGESQKHKRRKYDALQVALTIFPEADYALEEDIGDKRPDAKLVFDTPHEKYGKGLAIEYQHKNESKDRKATQEHFAKREFTTIWLWDEQYDYSTTPPDIDFLGGELYTPWPDAVPNSYGIGVDHHKAYLNQLKFDYEPNGDPSPILPPEYGMQFLDVDMLVKNAGGTHLDLLEAAQLDRRVVRPVRFTQDAEDYIYKRLFQPLIRQKVAESHNQIENGYVYKADSYTQEVRDSLDGPGVTLRTGPWIEPLLARRASVAYGDDAELRNCEECGEPYMMDAVKPTETVRSHRCGECGNWNVIKSKKTNAAEVTQ